MKQQSKINTHYTKVFTIYKVGINKAGYVDILRKNDESYNICAKIAFYKSLGYIVII